MTFLENGYEMIQNLVGSKWVPEILYAVEQESSHYNEIESSIPIISHTELQRKLKMLVEQNALKIEEKNQTSYHLTPFGMDLVHIFHHFEDLFERYSPEIQR